VEADLQRPHKLQIARSYIDDLLHAGPGVEEREEKGVVASAPHRRAIGRVEDGADLLVFEVLNGALAGPLEGQSEQPLAELEVLGVAGCGVAGKRVDGGETGVAGRWTIAPVCLKMVEEDEDLLRVQVIEVEEGDRSASTRSEEAKQERQGIPVASYCVGTRPSDPWELIGEEAAKGAGKGVR
jgi:hypothetical protein